MASVQLYSVSLAAIVGGILLAAVYVFGAWHIVQRRGRATLVPLWLTIALSSTAVGVFRLHRLNAALGTVPSLGEDAKRFLAGLVVALASLGLATLSVGERLRRDPEARLSAGVLLMGIAGFLGGLVVTGLAVLMFYEGG